MGEDLEYPGLNRAGGQPEPGPEGLSPSGWQARFSRQAGWTAGLRNYLYGRLDLASARRLLEVGCGTGALLGELLALSQAEVYGIDINPQYLAIAQKDKQAADPSRLSLILSDAHGLPFTPASFDLALCHFLLLWVVDPSRVLSEMRRTTRPGGAVLALAEPDYGGRIDYPPELAVLGERQRVALRRQGADPNLGRKLRSLFNAAGLVEVEAGVLGGQWRDPPAPDEFESEWAVLRSDLAGALPSAVLDQLQALDSEAGSGASASCSSQLFMPGGEYRIKFSVSMPSDSRISKIVYTEAVWRAGKIHPELARLLTSRDLLLIIEHGEPPYRVTFGVPHQAAAGAGQICNLRQGKNGDLCPREADENAAFYALGAYSALRELGVPSRLVIMVHPTGADPNKDLESPYCQEVFREPTRLLFECHGSRSSRRHDLELSAGKNPLAVPLQFGRRLSAAFGYQYPLAVQKEAGRSAAWVIAGPEKELDGRLELPANRTDSLEAAWRKGLPALHLEAKPHFRTPPDRTHALSSTGKLLGEAIAQTIFSE